MTLLQSTNIRRLGAFRVPPNAGLAYGGGLCALTPRGTLLISTLGSLVTEISIPQELDAPITQLNSALSYGSPYDITGGLMSDPTRRMVSGTANMLGGLLWSGDRWLWTCFAWYDAGNYATKSIGYTLGKDSTSYGPFALSGNATEEESGYIVSIPGLDQAAVDRVKLQFRDGWAAIWDMQLSDNDRVQVAAALLAEFRRALDALGTDYRALFGVPVASGLCGKPIVMRQSYGPALIGFDPSALGDTPATPTNLLWYPLNLNHGLAPWPKGDGVWNCTCTCPGAFFPSRNGISAFVGVGTRALGEVWYGMPKDEPRAPGLVDPYVSAHGYHAENYEASLWFWDPADLVKVKAGILQPWEPRPYSVAPLPGMYPFTRLINGVVGGCAYDELTGRLYVPQFGVDRLASGPLPVIHVYEVG